MKPKVSSVKWDVIYSKNGLEVFEDLESRWIDYRVKLNGKWAKRFYGETAHSDVTRFVHDQAIEFHDFILEDIYNFRDNAILQELMKRIEEMNNARIWGKRNIR